jgi:hypothetical protein
MGADTFYQDVPCKRPDGSSFKAKQQCWHKKSMETGKTCQTVCEAAINVCDGKHGKCE